MRVLVRALFRARSKILVLLVVSTVVMQGSPERRSKLRDLIQRGVEMSRSAPPIIRLARCVAAEAAPQERMRHFRAHDSLQA